MNATEKLTELQRGQDRAVRELRESVQGLKHQADALAGWHAWGVRRVSAWGVILGLLVAAAAAFSWRTYTVALRIGRRVVFDSVALERWNRKHGDR